MQKLKRQQGGTILGIVIGLVIGLGIALGVAVVINKTPVPFTDKFARIVKPEQAGPAADPNKPLYGNKTAAREAAKQFVKEKEADSDDAPPPPPNIVAQQPDPKTAKAEAKLEPQAPVTDLSVPEKKQEAKADSKAAVKEAKAEATEDKWHYYLQAGAFRDQNDAEGMRGKLALIGVEAKVSERQTDNGTMYRVRVGPFGKIDAMNTVRTKLSDNGVDAAVVRLAKQ